MAKELLALLLILLVPVAEGASIYKWVDEQGVTHYSAATPSNQKAQQVKTQAAPPAAEVDNNQSSMRNWEANEKAKDYQRRRAEQESAKEQERAEKLQRCAVAKQNLDLLLRQSRIYRMNENGERVYWDDEFHDAETARVKKEVENNCSS